MQHLSEMRVDLSAIRHNLRQIRQLIPPTTGIMAVIKADAYGHGVAPVAKTLENEGVNCFCIAHVDKAKPLREAGVKSRIIVLQPDFQIGFDAYRQHNLECCVHSLDDIELWRDGPVTAAHLFVDTGMGREGVSPETARLAAEKLHGHPVLRWVGLATHFATADSAGDAYERRQLTLFREAVAEIPMEWRAGVQLHAACSGAIINLPESHFDMVRPGILLYGLYPGEGREKVDQRPAMSVWARVTLVKQVPAGTNVGYGCEYTTPAPTWLAMLSLGYGDGVWRRKRPDARVWIGGKPYPIVGRVSMDQIMVDLQGDEVALGAEALIYGVDPETGLIRDAETLGTISYERCCHLGLRLPRVYTE